MGFWNTRKTTYDPFSAFTPEQRKSIEALMSLASTGTGGGITLGEQYGGALGSYDTSGQQTAYDQLMSLYNGQELGTVSDLYTRMANNKFNPDDPSSGYASFSRALAKSGAESSDALDREAAITGNRFGTAISGNKAKLGADMQNQRGMFLADLFNQGENRALQGAAGLQGLVGFKGNLAEAGSSQAAMINAVKDAQAKDALDEYKRTRAEELSRIGLMQEQWQNPMGSITKKSPSMFMSMLGETDPIVGSYNTHQYGYTTNQYSMAAMQKDVQGLVKSILSMYSGGSGGGSGFSEGTVNYAGMGGGSSSGSGSRLTDLYNSGGFNSSRFGSSIYNM
jgi:hypothetical protein